MSFLRTKHKRKRRVSLEDVLQQFEQSQSMQKALQAVENMRPRGDSLWSNNHAHLKPKEWFIGGKWCPVIGKHIVSARRFETKAEALNEAKAQATRRD